jgi:hypothetical protein
MRAGFHVAPYAPDGVPSETGFWEYGKLSPRWLVTCEAFLRSNGESFSSSWEGNLRHITTKLTSATGSALVTFAAKGTIAVSGLLLSGSNVQSDSEVASMFVESMRRIHAVRWASPLPKPFDSVLSLAERPLAVVVTWGWDAVSDEDHGLVKELFLHLAGAFFQMYSPPTRQ